MRLERLAVITFLLASLSGCNLLLPEGTYLRHRLDDLTEAAHADLAASIAVGALVNAGPALLGLHGLTGLEYGERLQLGLGGMVPLRTANGSGAAGVVVPLSWAEAEAPDGQPIDGYRSRYPGYASVGLDVGFMFGFGARLDFAELADFFCGIAAVDLLGDDERPPEQKRQEEKAEPPDHS